MHISRLLCAPLPEQAAMRGTSNDLQLQPIPVASVDKLAVSKITTVPCDSGDSPFKVVEKASFYFLFRLFPVSTPPVAFALLQESDAQTGTSGCYSVLIPDTYNAVVGVDSGVQLDDSYGDSKSSQEEGSTKTARCGFCKRRGHYSRTCPISLTSTPVVTLQRRRWTCQHVPYNLKGARLTSKLHRTSRQDSEVYELQAARPLL
ncbi:hypothetical protein R3P38DRAFT_2775089 [Favolaschia claudopus]|uniref:CCHC-type domain-containing protein n=1 Tax=Favolaschia claudopus TaxID=2862362 RepID=A0AAW0BSP5_9AGAR